MNAPVNFVAPIVEAAHGFLASQALLAAAELDLFTLLWPKGRSTSEIRARLGLPRRSAEVLLTAGVALGLLEEDDRVFRTRAAVAPYLVRSEAAEFLITDFMIREHYRDLYREFLDPVRVLRQEGAQANFVLGSYGEGYLAGERARKFHEYMDLSTRELARVLLETYSLHGRRRLLDLFGGRGRGCQELVEGTPGLCAQFMDLPEVIAGAGGGADPRVSGIGGDIFGAPLPSGFDVITIFRTAHDLDDERVRLIARRACETLPKGGELVIAERMVPADGGHGSPEALDLHLRNLAFLLVGPVIRFRTPGDYMRMLGGAGFGSIRVYPARRAPHLFYRGMHVVVARKV